MKLSDKNDIHMAAIAKYLSNEMSDNEKADFEIDVNLDPDNKELMLQIDKEWKMLKNSKMQNKPNSDEAWKRVSSRIMAEESQAQSFSAKPKRPRRIFAMAAAILALGVLASTMLWKGTSSQPEIMLSLVNSSENSTVVETLADGSIVYLANNTKLNYPEQFASDERLVKLNGLAYFDVARNPSKPFIIETKDAYIQVLGTAFNVKSNSTDAFELIVQRGKVKVTLKSNPEISQIVVAGEKVTSNSSSQLIKETWANDGSLDWRIGKMQFKDETIAHIVNVINKNYDSNITVDSKAAQQRLTVTFEKNTLNDITLLLCTALDLEQQQIDGKIMLTSK